MNTLTATSWFLTAEGWRSSDDRVAVWDAEVWPTGTLAAGRSEDDGRGLGARWTEHWRDEWRAGEVAAAMARYGSDPLRPVLAAA